MSYTPASLHTEASLARPDLPGIFETFEFHASTSLAAFVLTALAGGGAAPIATKPNGQIRFTGAATTAASGAQIQLPNPIVRLDAKPAYLEVEARIQINDVKARVAIGAAVTDANLFDGFTDGIVLLKDAGAGATWRLVIARASGATSNVPLGNIVADTKPHVVTVAFNSAESGSGYGDGQVKVYVDGVLTATGAYDATGSVPYDVNLAPSFGAISGDAAGTQAVDLDFLRFKCSRSFL